MHKNSAVPSRIRGAPRLREALSGALSGALILALLMPGGAASQTILNTERFQLEGASGFHVDADVSFSLERGNSDVVNGAATGIVGTVFGSHWPRLIFGGRYLSNDERSILDDQFLQLRYSYLLSPATRTFHFAQIQKNESLLLERRLLVGSGVRWRVAGSERAEVAVGTGVMGEWESLDADRLNAGEAADTNQVRMANLGVVSWEFESGARLLNIVYVQPDIGDFADLRLLNELGLSVPISDHIGTTLSFEWRRDTRPPASLERDDVTLGAGFSVEFP